ncbi:MAG: hypothetical protein JSS29_05590 [Proteobacteria bacterium]|nr:hypothetical protein [Pseudomonadota bacterium]
MQSAHGFAPAVGERSGARKEPAVIEAGSWMDDDAETIVFAVAGAGGLPRAGRRARALPAEEPESPYWATWGF